MDRDTLEIDEKGHEKGREGGLAPRPTHLVGAAAKLRLVVPSVVTWTHRQAV